MEHVRAVFERPALAEALQLAGKVQPWRRAVPMFDSNGKQLPPKMMPGVVRVDADTHSARLTVANFDMSITVEAPCNGVPGTMFLPLAPLAASTGKGVGTMVELLAAGHSVAFVCGRLKSATHAEPVDAPPIPAEIAGAAVTIPAQTLRKGLDSTEAATKDDLKRPWLGGVYIHDGATGPAFAAMDGLRVHAVTLDGEAIGAKAILPRAAARLLLGMLPDDGDVTIHLDARGACFAWGAVQFCCKLIDAQYPRFDDQLKRDGGNAMRANAAALLADLELVACVADTKLQEVHLVLGEACEAQASRNGPGFYSGSDSGSVLLDAEYSGTPMRVGFQLRLVSDALQLFGEREIIWRMGGPFDPTVISCPSLPGLEAMVSLLLPAGAERKAA
ncbi:hypothetical protein EIK56_24165 [Sphingomonas sp. C8-2]|nr:hypothetical protein EIK56_24165 [Sphingomonas sp. C8-2]